MMKFFQTSFLLSTTFLFVSAAPGTIHVSRRDVDPPFIDDGGGKCEGSADPLCCPPIKSLFLAAIKTNVNAGYIVNNTDIRDVTYPTGNDRESKIARVKFAMATVANMRGKNDGCPLDTTTLVEQLDTLVQSVDRRRDVSGKTPKRGKVQHPGELPTTTFFPIIDTYSQTVSFIPSPGLYSSPSPPTPTSLPTKPIVSGESFTSGIFPTASFEHRRDVFGKRGRVQHPGELSTSVTVPPTPSSPSPTIDTYSQTVTYLVPTPGVSSPLGTPPSTSLPTDSMSQVPGVKSSSTSGIFPTQSMDRRLDVFGSTPKRGKILHRHNSSMSTSKTIPPKPSFSSTMLSTVTDTLSLSVSTPGIDPSSTSGIFPTSTPVSDFSTSVTPPPSTSLTISLPTTNPTSTGIFPEIPSDTPSSISTPIANPSSTPVTEVSSSSTRTPDVSILPVTDPNSQSIPTTDSLPTLPSSTPIPFTSTPPLPSISSSAITPLPTESPTTSLPTMTLPSPSPGYYRRQNVNPNPNPIPSASVPAFGHISNLHPKVTQDGTVCDGYPEEDGTTPSVPCYCPPDFNTFYEALNANFLAGNTLNGTGSTEHTITFPLDDSKASKLARLVSAKYTLLNYLGKGEGCPVTSTNFTQQEKFIEGLPDQ